MHYSWPESQRRGVLFSNNSKLQGQSWEIIAISLKINSIRSKQKIKCSEKTSNIVSVEQNMKNIAYRLTVWGRRYSAFEMKAWPFANILKNRRQTLLKYKTNAITCFLKIRTCWTSCYCWRKRYRVWNWWPRHSSRKRDSWKANSFR